MRVHTEGEQLEGVQKMSIDEEDILRYICTLEEFI
jgi:hypothetical protein